MQNVYLSDITMKLADAADGFSLSFREKIELSKLLDRLNVSAIELAPIRSRKIDSLLIKSVAAAVKQSTVAVPVTQDVESVEITWAALKDARHPRLQVQAPMSPAQMEYFWHKKPDKLLEAIRDLVKRCRDLCPDVEFIADDACRSERSFLIQAISAAIESGATAITLCDAAGLMFPEEFTAFLQDIRTCVPALSGIRLGVLCNDALSMSSACAVAALRSGATEVKVASYSGNVTHTAEMAAILYGRGDDLGLYSDIRHSEIKRITSQIDWMCRTHRPQGSPFDLGVQDKAERADMTLSKHDDRAAIQKAIEKLGYELSEDDISKVYDSFKSIAAKKESVSARELDTIVASVALQVPPTYRLQSYVINCGNLISASAHLTLRKGEESLEGICLGDGPIDASFLAFEQILGHHYELDDFQIQAVTEGREAMGETIVRLRSNGKLYSGRGISTDIVGASIQAYINALNKIVYEEAEV